MISYNFTITFTIPKYLVHFICYTKCGRPSADTVIDDDSCYSEQDSLLPEARNKDCKSNSLQGIINTIT